MVGPKDRVSHEPNGRVVERDAGEVMLWQRWTARDGGLSVASIAVGRGHEVWFPSLTNTRSVNGVRT
jgi:hypothetical protein